MHVLDVWPGDVPADYGEVGDETFRPPPSPLAKGAKWLTNVTKPTISVYRPADDVNSRVAIVICPGGGYWDLCWDVEGEEVAAWLVSVGVTGVLLKYRCPRRPGQPEELPAPGPLLDSQRALRIVRANAQEWDVDPGRVGIVGFSAGGHLALATATLWDSPTYEPIDAIDEQSCRPDFAISLYAGYLVDEQSGALAPHMRIPAGTPPVFLAHAGDDTVSPAIHSVGMYLALQRAGIPAELHAYTIGGHGLGVRTGDHPSGYWTDRCVEWLRDLRVL